MHLRATTSGYVTAWGSWVARRNPTPGNLPERCPSRFNTLTAENGLPASLKWPSAASSRDISRSERCPPFGRLRRSCFARATTSGRNSAWLLRPLALAGGGAPAVSGDPELGDEAGLLVLGERAGDLPHHLAGRVAGVGSLRRRWINPARSP